MVHAPFICGSDSDAQAVRMIRKIAAAGLASVLLGCLPAHAQEIQDVPELEGAPGPLKIPPAQPKPQPKPQVKAPVAAPKPSATTIDNAKVLAAQRAEQARLDKQAADLKAQQAQLDTRAAELSAREKGLSEREARLVAEQAELARQSDAVARQLAEARAAPAPVARRDEAPAYRDEDQPSRYVRVDREEAIQACARAGDDEARARRYYSARYGSEPQFYAGRISELRGVMRVEDRRGYMILDSVCRVDADGDVQSFTFLR